MALPPILPQFKESIRQSIHLFGATTTVEKKEQPTPIPGPVCASGRRRAEDRTEGIGMADLSMVTMRDEWDAAVGRPPRRGDVIVLSGVRYGVTDFLANEVSGVDLTYEMAVAT